MRRLDYSALALGARELAGGSEVQQMLRSAGVPVLAANLSPAKQKQWGAVSSKVARFPRFSVGIIGMTGELKTDFKSGYFPKVPEPVSAHLTDYAESLGGEIKSLSKTSDVLVVLTQADLGKASELVRKFPEIDVLISATDAYFGREPLVVGRSVLLFSGKEGQRVGQVRLKVFPNRSVGVVSGRLVRLGAEISPAADYSKLAHESISGANQWHRARALAALPQNQPSDSPYRGSETCKDCHAEAYRAWRSSSHARAMSVLEENHRDFLPQCVSCHVTGWGRPGGFRNRVATPNLTQVQCEACHGPAAGHLDDTGAPYGRVGLQSCAATCHTPEQTGGHFDLEASWERIRH